jgi:excisionase family DNA binding protein
MTVREAASFLGVTERTIRNYTKKGLLSKEKKGREPRLRVEEVTSLKEDMESAAPIVTRQEILRHRAQIRRLESHMEVVLRMLDAKDAPLGMSAAYSAELYQFACAHLKKSSWEVSEVSPWTEIFERLSEDDLATISDATKDPHPWRTFLRLCTSMMSFVVGQPGYATSLDLQGLHRSLSSSRRKLRVSAFIYGEMAGALSPEIEGFALSSRTSSDTLFRKILKSR